MLGNDIKEVLFTEAELAQAVRGLGVAITQDYAGRSPLIVTVLHGSFVFLADLVREIDTRMVLDFMAVSSYGPQAREFGVVQVLKDLDAAVTGRDVIVVEDVIDTGLSLNYLLQLLRSRHPASIKVCALLDRSVRRIAEITVDYKGFDLPDVFVVGYGLDYRQRYRNLPYIGTLRSEIMTGQS